MQYTVILVLIIVLTSCVSKTKKAVLNEEVVTTIQQDTTKQIEPIAIIDTTELEHQMLQAGLVNIQQIDSTILTDIRYSQTNNFLKKDIYGQYNKAYALPFVAQKLKQAQEQIKTVNPNYSLIIFDAARPKSAQQKMWNILDMPIAQKQKYVSNPQKGSLHNFGAAIDLSIYNDSTQSLLDMGTPYDFFGKKAYPKYETQQLQAGELTQLQVNNRLLLRKTMAQVGLKHINTEWWHFNACTRKQAWENYKIIE